MDDGCNSEGCGGLTQLLKHEYALNLARGEQKVNGQKCREGDRNHCSVLKNTSELFLYKVSPSTIGVHYGSYGQIGNMAEIGTYRETSHVFNWRTGQYAKMKTEGYYGYMGAPEGLAGGFYVGTTKVRGSSDIYQLQGMSLDAQGQLGLDFGLEAGASKQTSLALSSEENKFIKDPVSKMYINTQQTSISISANIAPTGLSGAGTFGLSDTTIVNSYQIPWWP